MPQSHKNTMVHKGSDISNLFLVKLGAFVFWWQKYFFLNL